MAVERMKAELQKHIRRIELERSVTKATIEAFETFLLHLDDQEEHFKASLEKLESESKEDEAKP